MQFQLPEHQEGDVLIATVPVPSFRFGRFLCWLFGHKRGIQYSLTAPHGWQVLSGCDRCRNWKIQRHVNK